MKRIYLQLFASSKSNSQTASTSTSHSTEESASSYSKEGGSHSETSTVGQSVTNAESHSYGHTEGNSSSISTGKTWASGAIDDKTQQNFDKYNNEYVQSDKVTAAYDALQQTLTNKPTFESQYSDKLTSLYDQLMNRDSFNYNFNEDQMYQMYRDRYAQEGKTAMQDTLGAAQASNGGYGSSYAQSAAQQTYQNYLKQANDIIPTLRNQAYEEYQAEGQDLLNKYNITNNAYNNEYGQYRDQVSDWQADRAYNQSAYQDERNFDYSQFTDNRNYWNQEYWNEKNAEQSNYQASNTWYQEDSQTDTYSKSQTDYWENSVTDTSYWENGSSNTSSVANGYTSNFSQTLSNAQSLSGYTGSNANKGSNFDWTGYQTTYQKAMNDIKDTSKQYDSGWWQDTANQIGEIDARSGQNAVSNSLKSSGVGTGSSLYQNGAVFALDDSMSGLTAAQVKTVIKDMVQNPSEYGLDGTVEELDWIAKRYSSSSLETILGKAMYQKLFG